MRSNKRHHNTDQLLKKYWTGMYKTLDKIKEQNAASDLTFMEKYEVVHMISYDLMVPEDKLLEDPDAFRAEMNEEELAEIEMLNNPSELKMQPRF